MYIEAKPMNSIRIFAALSAIIMFTNVNLYGQRFHDGISGCFHCQPIPQSDWGIIGQTTVSRKFTEKIKGEFNVQSRIMENATTLSALMLEPGIKFKFNQYLAVKTAFRYTFDANEYNKQRVHIAAYYVWHKEGVPLRIQYRTRVEAEGSIFWRNRLKIAGNFRGILKPYSSYEIFNQSLNAGFFDLYRIESGIKWEFHNMYNLTVMYRLESNFQDYWNSPAKTTAQVIGLMFNYSIKS